MSGQAESAIQGQGRVGKVFGYAAMVAVLAVIAVPLFWIVVTSFKAHDHIYVRPAEYLPIPFTPENYSDVTTRIPFFAYFRNSVIITFFTAGIKIVLGVLSAYALSLLRFPGSQHPLRGDPRGAHGAQPDHDHQQLRPCRPTRLEEHLPGHHHPARRRRLRHLPHAQPVPVVAARDHRGRPMDGAGPFKLLWRVVMPLSWPTLVAFSLITIVNEWNEYLWPFLMSDDERTAPLQVGLTMLQNNDGVHQLGAGHGRHGVDHPPGAHPLPRPATPDDQGPDLRGRQELNRPTRAEPRPTDNQR
jgi:sn-glycerol 3-phosphate transport system permease protein